MIDTSQTCRYLACLLGDHALPVTWQVFDDATAGRVIPRHWPATLSEARGDLTEASRQGAGVYVAVNECAGGRTARDVVRVRALFLDLDDPTAPEPAWHLPTTMVVKTPGGWHGYWLVDDCPLGEFKAAQKRLIAHYGSDPAIHDLPRVLRVPGFPHQKAEPRPVELYHVAEPRLVYDLAQVLAGLPEPAPVPVPDRTPRPLSAVPQGQSGDWSTCDAAGLFRSAGLYRRDLGGGKHAVGCPWEAEHSTRAGEADTSTVLWEASGGSGGWPQFRCSHAHCDHRRWRDVVEALGPGLVAAHCERGEWRGERMRQDRQEQTVRHGDSEPPDEWDEVPMPEEPRQIESEAATTATTAIPALPAPEAKPVITYFWGLDLVESDFPEPPDVIGPGVLGPGDFGVLAGEPKAGKSMVLMAMVAAWCQGLPWHGLTVDRPLKVAMLQVEIGISRYARRMKRLALDPEAREALRGRLLVSDRCLPMIGDPAQAAAHGAQVGALLSGPPDLFVVDPLANLFTGRNENDNAEMGLFLRHMRMWQRACGPDTAMLMVHHAGKPQENSHKASPFHCLRGASALRGAYDAGIVVAKVKPDDDSDPRRRLFFELRNGPPLPALTVEWHDGAYVALESAEQRAKGLPAPGYSRDRAVLDLLSQEWTAGRRHSGRSLARLADEKGVMTEPMAERVIKDLQDCQPPRIRKSGVKLPSGAWAIEVVR